MDPIIVEKTSNRMVYRNVRLLDLWPSADSLRTTSFKNIPALLKATLDQFGR
jgi:hypothetical protein